MHVPNYLLMQKCMIAILIQDFRTILFFLYNARDLLMLFLKIKLKEPLSLKDHLCKLIITVTECRKISMRYLSIKIKMQ